MKFRIELTEKDVRRIVAEYIQEMTGNNVVNPEYIKIEVKSKQNYKSEWEIAAFRAVYERG
jgi:hypothetical protein